MPSDLSNLRAGLTGSATDERPKPGAGPGDEGSVATNPPGLAPLGAYLHSRLQSGPDAELSGEPNDEGFVPSLTLTAGSFRNGRGNP